MRKLLTIITLLYVFFTSSFAQDRPKVAVVLSGGGAKGVAHVSALKVIEEAGIPIDYVVGTSMGSIIGGLYASGYTVVQLDSLVRQQNWMDLLMDKTDRSTLSVERKQKQDKYMASVYFEKSPFEVMEGGFLKGNSVSLLMCELTADLLEPMSYDDLPIPFACVATDILTNKEIVMREGILAESMRTSMAIPGVFPPVKRDGMVLVDGGLMNNYPVDVAREMGADIVIGVNVAADAPANDNVNSTLDVLLQVFGTVCSNKLEENIDDTDLYIHVDVKGFNAASFTSTAIDTLLARGEDAARSKWTELQALHDKLAEYGEPLLVERKPKRINVDISTINPPATIYNIKNKQSFIGVGARFDTEELASIILGGEYEFNHDKNFKIGLEARLGKRQDLSAYTSISPGTRWNVELRYRMTNNNMKIYNNGEHLSDIRYNKHRVRLDFNRSGRKFRFNFGAQFSYMKYTEIMFKNAQWDKEENSPYQSDLLKYLQDHNEKKELAVLYYVSLQFDNQNSRLLPSNGMKWMIKYNYATDNGYNYYGNGGVNLVEGYWRMAIPLTRTTILNPSIEGRFIQNSNQDLSNCNFIGGINTYGHYVTQQLAFAGINFVQIAPNSILIGGLNLRQHLTTNNYLFAQANYAFCGETLSTFIKKDNLVGAAIGYGYKSPAGPIELNFNWSNATRKLGFYLSMGYMF